MREAEEIISMDGSGLITDVDGTISQIVDDPANAVVDPRIAASLDELARQLSLLALLSGRSVHQLHQLVDIERLVYVGNHGLERWEAGQAKLVPGAEEYLAPVATVLRQLREELSIPGVFVEDKGITGTVHYRLCSDPARARSAILDAAARAAVSAKLRIAEGRKSVSILPAIPFNKGTAVEMLVRDYHLRGVIYLGDDSTDIDAFRSLRRLAGSQGCRTLLIGVCTPESPDELQTAVDFCVPGVEAVAGFLRECSRFMASGK